MLKSELYWTERNPVSGAVYAFMSVCDATGWSLGLKKMSADQYAQARLSRSVDALAAASTWTADSPGEDEDVRDTVDFVDPLLTYTPDRWNLGAFDDDDDDYDDDDATDHAGETDNEQLTAR